MAFFELRDGREGDPRVEQISFTGKNAKRRHGRPWATQIVVGFGCLPHPQGVSGVDDAAADHLGQGDTVRVFQNILQGMSQAALMRDVEKRFTVFKRARREMIVRHDDRPS